MKIPGNKMYLGTSPQLEYRLDRTNIIHKGLTGSLRRVILLGVEDRHG
jgi:hypothetical protein